MHITLNPRTAHVAVQISIRTGEMPSVFSGSTTRYLRCPVGYPFIPFQIRTAIVFTAMATHTITVKHRLNFMAITETTLFTLPFLYLLRHFPESFHLSGDGYHVPIFVTTDTREDFTRHSSKPTPHDLQRFSFGIKRLDEDRCVGRNLEDCRTIFFHIHFSDNTFYIPRAIHADRT